MHRQPHAIAELPRAGDSVPLGAHLTRAACSTGSELLKSCRRFVVAELPVTPWKNGGGDTRELASWPPGAGLESFDWRVSIATIAASGPFSVFTGVDRTIMLLQGDGVHLRSRDGHLDHRLDRPFQPFAFSGDVALDCTLLGAASSDLNLMTRRGGGRAALKVLSRSALLDATPHGLLLSLRGSWQVRGEAPARPGAARAANIRTATRSTGARESTATTIAAARGDAMAATEDCAEVLEEGHGLWWADVASAWQVVPRSSGARLAWVSIDSVAAQTVAP